MPLPRARADQSTCESWVSGRQMSGDEADLLSHPPVGDRDARRRGHGDRTGYAGHNGVRNAGGHAGRDFFVAPAEDEGIATLEPHHDLACAGSGDEQGVDVLLGSRTATRDLGDVDDLNLWRELIQQRLRDETVGHDDLGGG